MRRFGLVLACSLLLVGPVWGKTLAVVNGQKIDSLDLAVADPAAAGNPAVEQQVLQVMISRLLLAQEADRSGKLDTTKMQAATAVYKTQLLADAEAQAYLQKHPVSAEAVQKAYDTAVKNDQGQELRARIILVPSKSQATTILQDLRQGKSFSDLAAQYSTAKNAALGGELGWVPEAQLDAAYLPALQQQVAVGTISGPISVPQGWAIVQKLGERAMSKPTLEQLRPQLELSLRNAALASYVAELRKKAQVELGSPAKKG